MRHFFADGWFGVAGLRAVQKDKVVRGDGVRVVQKDRVVQGTMV
jgi:hypothetical protein